VAKAFLQNVEVKNVCLHDTYRENAPTTYLSIWQAEELANWV